MLSRPTFASARTSCVVENYISAVGRCGLEDKYNAAVFEFRLTNPGTVVDNPTKIRCIRNVLSMAEGEAAALAGSSASALVCACGEAGEDNKEMSAGALQAATQVAAAMQATVDAGKTRSRPTRATSLAVAGAKARAYR
jgi:hypothetical protein